MNKAENDAFKLQCIIDGTNLGTWEWNVQTGETVFNEIWAQIIGYTLDELAPISIKTWEALAYPDDMKTSSDLLERHFSGEHPYYNIECRMKHKYGHWVWVHDRGKVISRSADGKPLMMFGTHADITERKCAEEQLRASENKWKTLYSILPSGISILDEQGKLVEFNSTLGSILAIDEEGLRQGKYLQRKYLRSDGTAMSSDEFPSVRAIKEQCTIQNVVIGVEKEDGALIWAKVSAAPLNLPGISCVLSTTDITERKQAEEVIRESEARFREVLENSLDASYKRNLLTNSYEYLSPVFAQISGYTPEEMKTLPTEFVLAFIHPDDLPQIDHAIAESMAKSAVKPFQVEYRFKHKDGLYRWFLDRFIVLRDADSQPVARIGSVSDITVRKELESALNQSKELLRDAVDAGKMGVYSFDFIANNSYYSPAFLAIYGLKPESTLVELDENNVPIMLHPDDKKDFLRAITGSNDPNGFGILEHEYRIIRSDMQVRWLKVLGKTHFNEGRPFSAKGTIRDITEQKNLNDAVDRLQKLESLGLIAGGIAHNFNNLMGGIFGYIDMALEKSTDQKITSYLSKAVNSIDRARALTQQILTFAKGGGPVQQVTPLIPFVQETAQATLSRLNVPCTFDIAGDLLPCSIDKIQIGLAIESIITNAQEAMPSGGPIDLTSRNVSLEESGHPTLVKGNYVKISIRDHGIGIQRENLSSIFDPFYTTKPTGQGLGLATCFSIINRHGGAIDVESTPGNGSTFHIYLPAASLENVSSSITQSATMNLGASGTFLIMDDEKMMRETTTDMLESLGYTVISKENGRDTVDFFTAETKANRRFAGLILDLTIPHGMGGKATVAEIRKLNTEIPIFVASGYADDPVVKNPTEYGFTASICKPFRRSELSEMLNKYLKTKN